MITNISHLTLFVKDQEKSLVFYTEKLGFKKHTDAEFGPMRWLTLTAAGQPDMELVLMLATTPEEKALVGKQGAGRPLFSVQSDDCEGDYKRLSEAGIVFTEEPKHEPWGVGATFQDVDGNAIYMCQPAA